MAINDPIFGKDTLKKFGSLSVAILDPDAKSAQLTRNLLSTLGVYQFRILRDANELKDSLLDTSVDVILADMGSKTDKELEAIYNLRRESSEVALTPVIALSLQTTASDVRRLLDVGASEIVAKPANARSVFARLQCIIDCPRSFVSTKQFKGPDRRRRVDAKTEGENRQLRSPVIIDKEQFTQSGLGDQPAIIMPDFSLKLKVANTSTTLRKPQIESEFLFWALSDVAALETAYTKLSEGAHPTPLIERISTACLSIKARASAYNYTLGAKVAGLLSDFCRNYFQPGQPSHMVVLEKHIQVLATIFNQRLYGNGGDQGQELLSELSQLVKKYINS